MMTGDREDRERMFDQRSAAVDARRERLRAQLAEVTAARDGASGDDEHDPEGETLASRWSHLTALWAACDTEDAEIARARAAADAGRFARCTECGAAIDPARLEALPLAQTCIACARRGDGGR